MLDHKTSSQVVNAAFSSKCRKPQITIPVSVKNKPATS